MSNNLNHPQEAIPKRLVIGTRGSALAMWQAETVASKIANIGQTIDHDIDVEIKVIKTSGDWKPCQGEVKLDAAKGGKALFAKEIEEALLAEAIDVAIHSMKDLESVLPKGLMVPFMLPRSDARDAFLSHDKRVVHPKDLPQGAVVGTASVRRQAFLLKQRPDVRVVTIRGNVDTRLRKLKAGQVDATFLAIAGLERLGLEHEASSILPVDEMLPPVGQGAIGLQLREGDLNRLSWLSQISCNKTYICVEAERAVIQSLGGGCHTPVGVYATINPAQPSLRDKSVASPCMLGASARVRGYDPYALKDNMLEQGCILDITAQVVSPDGSESWEQHRQEHVLGLEEARAIGHSIGAHLKKCVPPSILV